MILIRIAPLLILASSAVAVTASAQQASGSQPTAPVAEWILPRFATAPVQQKQVVVTQSWTYTEARYEPNLVIDEFVSQPQARYDTPENTLVSRASSIMNSDYDWWFSIWDSQSQPRVAERAINRNEGREYFEEWWETTTQKFRFHLQRRIVTDDGYVILTYKMARPGSQPDDQSLELPVAMERDGENWKITAALSGSALLPASPWVSGKQYVEAVIR